MRARPPLRRCVVDRRIRQVHLVSDTLPNRDSWFSHSSQSTFVTLPLVTRPCLISGLDRHNLREGGLNAAATHEANYLGGVGHTTDSTLAGGRFCHWMLLPPWRHRKRFCCETLARQLTLSLHQKPLEWPHSTEKPASAPSRLIQRRRTGSTSSPTSDERPTFLVNGIRTNGRRDLNSDQLHPFLDLLMPPPQFLLTSSPPLADVRSLSVPHGACSPAPHTDTARLATPIS